MDAMPGGGCIRITIDQKKRDIMNNDETINLVIEDTGCGISKEIQENIFNPFFSTKKDGKGTGLGLSICEGLIRGHGGEISLDTTAELGSRFIIKLPIHQSN